MRIIILILTITSLLILHSCSKEMETECITKALDGNMLTENFKTDFNIQFPSGYKGIGMVGFEGNFFYKYNSDSTIMFNYNFCGSLYCEDFGEALESEFPDFLVIDPDQGPQYTLDDRQFFCKNDEEEGVLYYREGNPSQGLYFMKIDQDFLEALNIEFDISQKEEVFSIIATIHEK